MCKEFYLERNLTQFNCAKHGFFPVIGFKMVKSESITGSK